MTRHSIVTFHTPLPDEDPAQLYVLADDPAEQRVDIIALHTGLAFAPRLRVEAITLKVVPLFNLTAGPLTGRRPLGECYVILDQENFPSLKFTSPNPPALRPDVARSIANMMADPAACGAYIRGEHYAWSAVPPLDPAPVRGCPPNPMPAYSTR